MCRISSENSGGFRKIGLSVIVVLAFLFGGFATLVVPGASAADVDPLTNLQVTVEILEVRALDVFDSYDSPDLWCVVEIAGQLHSSDIIHAENFNTSDWPDAGWTIICDVDDNIPVVDIVISLYENEDEYNDVYCDIVRGSSAFSLQLEYSLLTASYDAGIYDYRGDSNGLGHVSGEEDGPDTDSVDCEIWFRITQNDYDKDGLTYYQETNGFWVDYWEYHTDPYVGNTEDFDCDGLTSTDEYSKSRTSPIYSDSDDDGIPDGYEYHSGEAVLSPVKNSWAGEWMQSLYDVYRGIAARLEASSTWMDDGALYDIVVQYLYNILGIICDPNVITDGVRGSITQLADLFNGIATKFGTQFTPLTVAVEAAIALGKFVLAIETAQFATTYCWGMNMYDQSGDTGNTWGYIEQVRVGGDGQFLKDIYAPAFPVAGLAHLYDDAADVLEFIVGDGTSAIDWDNSGRIDFRDVLYVHRFKINPEFDPSMNAGDTAFDPKTFQFMRNVNDDPDYELTTVTDDGYKLERSILEFIKVVDKEFSQRWYTGSGYDWRIKNIGEEGINILESPVTVWRAAADICGIVYGTYELVRLLRVGSQTLLAPMSQLVEEWANPGPSVPSHPLNLQAVAVEDGIYLAWDQPSSDGGFPIYCYHVYREDERIYSAWGQMDFVDTTAAPGQTYEYTVSAENTIGESARSFPAYCGMSVTTPSEPVDVTATSGNEQITLTWNPPESDGGCQITSYKIYSGRFPGTETYLESVNGLVTEYVDTGLTNGFGWYYRIRAVNYVGEGPLSAEVWAIPQSVPGAPTNVNAVHGNEQVTLTWSDPLESGGTHLIGANIYYGIPPSPAGTFLDYVSILEGDGHTYVHTGLTNGLTYGYRVSWLNDLGEGPLSDEVVATPSPQYIPSEPQNLVVQSGNVKFFVNWDPPLDDGNSAITNYKIYLGKWDIAHSFWVWPEDEYAIVGSAATSYVWTEWLGGPLWPGELYAAMVSAINEVGEGPTCVYDSEICHSPDLPTEPLDPEAVRDGDCAICLSWTAPYDDGDNSLQSYEIYRSTDGISFSWIDSIPGGTTQFVDDNLVHEQTYYYKLTAINTVGESPASATASCKAVRVSSLPVSESFADLSNWVIDSAGWTVEIDSSGDAIVAPSLKMYADDGGCPNGRLYFESQTNDLVFEFKVKVLFDLFGGSASIYIGGKQVIWYTSIVTSVYPELTGYRTIWVPHDDGLVQLLYYMYGYTDVFRLVIEYETGDYSFYRNGNLISTLNNWHLPGSYGPFEDIYFRVSAQYPMTMWVDDVAIYAPSTPSAPTNLVASPGPSEVTLSWAPPSSDGGYPVEGYNVYRVSAGNRILIDTVDESTVIYTEMGLTNGVQYIYEVTALNCLGEGASSGTVVATPNGVSPSEPLNVQAVSSSENALTISWDPPSYDGGLPLMSYSIYRGASADPSDILYLCSVNGNITEYEDVGLIPGATYFYRISAVNEAGEGPLSSTVSAVPVAGLPTEPLNLQATPGYLDISLTWAPPDSDGGSLLTHYLVYRRTDSEPDVCIADVSGVSTAYIDSEIETEVTYYYKIAAMNSVGVGPFSNEAAAVVPIDPAATAPSAPQDFQVSEASSLVNLSWIAPLSDGGYPVTGYALYRGVIPGGEIPYLTFDSDVYDFSDIDVSLGCTYYYRISAANLIGEGLLSPEVSATTWDYPSAPQDLQAIPGDAQIDLVWTAPSDGGTPIISYEVYRSTDGTFFQHYDSVLGYLTGYTDEYLVYGEYFYYLTSLNAIGESSASVIVSATPLDEEAPSTSSSLSGTPGSNGWYTTDVDVTLTATDAISGVSATYYKIDGGVWTQYTTSFPITNGAHTVYYYSIDVAGNVEDTQSVVVDVDTAAPSTSSSLSGTLGSNGWYTTTVTVTLTGTDSISGVQYTYWKVDSSSWSTYSAPFSIVADGLHDVYFYSVDYAGNIEVTKSIAIGIDSEGPLTIASVDVGIVILTASDAVSGVASTHYRVDDGVWSTYSTPFSVGSGEHTVDYYSIDNAGNIETVKTTTTSSWTITVTYPNLEETLEVGETYDITWLSEYSCGEVDIDLYESGFPCMNIATYELDDGVYSWRIHEWLPPGNEYTIVVSNGSVLDESDNFFRIVSTTSLLLFDSFEGSSLDDWVLDGRLIELDTSLETAIDPPSLMVVRDGTEEAIATRFFRPQSGHLIVQALVKVSDSAPNCAYFYVGGGQVTFAFYSNQFRWYDTSWHSLMNYNINQVYEVRFDIDTVNGTYLIYIDDVLRTPLDSPAKLRYGLDTIDSVGFRVGWTSSSCTTILWADDVQVFAESCTCTLSVEYSVGGYTDPPEGSSIEYELNSNVTISAYPDLGYKFVYWLIDGTTKIREQTTTILMDTDHTVYAYFKAGGGGGGGGGSTSLSLADAADRLLQGSVYDGVDSSELADFVETGESFEVLSPPMAAEVRCLLTFDDQPVAMGSSEN